MYLPRLDTSPPREQDSTAFTKSERTLMDYRKLKKMSAQDIEDLIKDMLHNKEFDPDDVGDNMHERLICAVDDGEMDIMTCGRKVMENRTLDSSSARWRLCYGVGS